MKKFYEPHEYQPSWGGAECGVTLENAGFGAKCWRDEDHPLHAAWTPQHARYDELAERIHLYYHLDATIDSDVKEFAELRWVLGKEAV